MGRTREEGWSAIHAALPSGWRVGRVVFAPGQGSWRVTASSLKPPGRGNLPTTVTGEGPDDVAALDDLSSRLRGFRPGRSGPAGGPQSKAPSCVRRRRRGAVGRRPGTTAGR